MVAMSKVAKAVLVRTNIRFVEEVSLEHLIALLKSMSPHKDMKDHFYILAFFEEVYPSLMKKFMAEFSISREEILQVYHQYEGHGEMRAFSEALKNGRF